MLPYVLAIAVGLSSSVLFLTAFFLKDIHRQDDFFWSGIGLFYALVLWFCATSITGAVLLGQLAAVALLTAYFWQVIKLRGALAHPEQQPSLDSFSVVNSLKNLFGRSTKTTPETAVEATQNSLTKTAPESSFPLTTVTKETVAATSDPEESTKTEAKSSVEIQKLTPISTTPQPKSTSEANSATQKEETSTTTVTSDKTIETPPASPTEIPAPTPEVESVPNESETTEIAVETATIVEEDTNWADEDEVDDIPVSAVKVIEEVPATSESEPEIATETADSPTSEFQNNHNTESKPNSDT